MGEDRISQNVIKRPACQRYRQILNAGGIEVEVVPVIEDPVRVRIISTSLINCIERYINTPVIALSNAPAGQRNAAIPSKVEHPGILPIRMFQLEIEIREVFRRG